MRSSAVAATDEGGEVNLRPQSDFAPLVRIPLQSETLDPSPNVSKALVDALKKSGFLRITTPLVPLDLQKRALEAATEYLAKPSNDSGQTGVTKHPTDPKSYAMLTCREECQAVSPVLAEYFQALELAKTAVLRCIAVGLDLEPSYFSRLHSENNSVLRLLRYPTASEKTGNRCKEHSDYGTITLLLTDGVSGLEAFHDGRWIPVPHASGALVVNAGSLLEKWTNGRIPATLHRVAGPASEGSTSSPETLLDAVGRDRTSIAFFADPNEDATATLQSEENDAKDVDVKQMSVADYIRWRSGGDGNDDNRSGLAFTEEEEERIRGSCRKRKNHPN